MCRLFGFRSVLTSQVHSSLVSADNALMGQSEFHPHGWGVVYYQEKTPHVIKSGESALKDQLFKKVSGIVSSETVLAHIRKATQGESSILNSHPFQYGPWVFAHNGNIENFEDIKEEITNKIPSKFRKYILGNTDSETLFYYLISEMDKHFDLSSDKIDFNKLASVLEKTLMVFLKEFNITLHDCKNFDNDKSYLTFILTNGKTMIGFNGGQHLNFCTYKTSCPEKEHCSFYNNTCEQKTSFGDKVNHLILSSEEFSGVNVWTPVKLGQMIGVDHNLELFSYQVPIKFKAT